MQIGTSERKEEIVLFGQKAEEGTESRGLAVAVEREKKGENVNCWSSGNIEDERAKTQA